MNCLVWSFHSTLAPHFIKYNHPYISHIFQTWFECEVPKLSSSSPSVVILPVTPDILYSKSPKSWIELIRIRQFSSNRPCSSWGSKTSIAVEAYWLTILWPAFSDVSRTNSDSSERPWENENEGKSGEAKATPLSLAELVWLLKFAHQSQGSGFDSPAGTYSNVIFFVSYLFKVFTIIAVV